MNKIMQPVEIDLSKNAVYVVIAGKVIQLDKPTMGYGKQEIHWQAGKVTHIDYKYSQKI